MKAVRKLQLGGCLRLMAAMLMIGLGGCATVWEPVHGRIESSRWSVQAPEGWMRFSGPTYEMISKDGPYLQYMFLQEKPVSADFRHTQQHIGADMLPHEVAQVVIDNLRADKLIGNFALLENTPARVGGQDGFKLVYTYQGSNGVTMKTVHYGTVHCAHFFNMRYTAAQRHYFAADLAIFKQAFATLQLSDG